MSEEVSLSLSLTDSARTEPRNSEFRVQDGQLIQGSRSLFVFS